MNTRLLIKTLQKLGVKLFVEDGLLKAQDPKGVLTPELSEEIKYNKTELINLLITDFTNIKKIQKISRRPDNKYPVLSATQERFWFLSELEDQAGIAYNESVCYLLNGSLSQEAIGWAFSELIKRHSIFRTKYKKSSVGSVEQVIVGGYGFNINHQKVMDKGEAEAIFVKSIAEPFDLNTLPLIRVHLLELSSKEFILIMIYHHIIMDAMSSVSILMKELSQLYSAYMEEKSPDLPKLPIEYIDYVYWEKEEFKTDSYKKKQKYWNEKLACFEDLQLPLDKSRPAVFSYKGNHINFELDKKLSGELKALAKTKGTTLYSLLLSAFNILLSRYSAQEDIIVCTVVANRNQEDIQSILGCFINTLILRNKVLGDKSFDDFLSKVSEDTIGAFLNQEVPFDKLVQSLGIPRDTSRNPISQVMFILQTAHSNINLDMSGVEILPYSLGSNDTAIFDLMLEMFESSDLISGNFEYCTDLFNQETIERISRNFERLLKAIVENSSTKIKDLRLITDERRKQILIDWNDTSSPYPKDKTIYQLFEDQVNKSPDNIAVIFEDDKLSYKELNQKSNQLAHLIRAKYKKQNKKDLKPDSLIGLCVERSLDMIIGILGILKAGAAYVPLDPDYPQDRLEYMIEDSHEGLIITQKDIVAKDGFLDKLHHNELLVIDSDEVKAELTKQSDANLEKVSGPDNLAYVIYTSGSTGKPKGVQQEQGACVNRISWMQQEYKLKAGETYLHKTPISFDVSFGEILWPLSAGGKLIIAKPSAQGDLPYLSDLIFKHKIKNIHFVPALLSVFCDYIRENKLQGKLKYLKRVFCSGEALTIDHRSQLLGVLSVQLHNLYGPTESGEISSYDCSQDEGCRGAILSIGKPINNSQFYILDNNLNPCPIGAPGELYIGGAGLARGYLNQEELTIERFIPNPFAKELGLSKFDRIYKTGDLVRWLPDGNIEYLGRTDFQVKIRGFRIELGEIENVLAKHKNISQVSVIDKEKEGQKYLVAYYVIAKDKKDPEIDALRDHLSETLPNYMVPAAFVKLDEIPLTPNGKINRRALPEPDMSLMGEEYIAPRNETEEKLAQIWSDILKIDKNKVGIHDNFFHLGGNSLLAIQLVARIHAKLNCDISIKDLFDKPKLMDLALFIESQVKEGTGVAYSPIKKTKLLKDGNAMSFAQERLWFLNEFEGSNENYNIPMVVRLEGKLDINALKSSLNQLIARHASFRTVFAKDKTGVGVQKILDKLELALVPEKLDSKSKGKALEKIIKAEINKEISTPFDFIKGPLIRVRLFEVKGGEHVLVFNHHHIISDGVSVDIILKELSEFYQANLEKREPKLDKLPIQYVDFAAWQRAEFKKLEFQDKLKYWKDTLCDYSDLHLPTDKSRPTTFSYKGADFGFSLDKDLSAKLSQLAQNNGTTLYMVLLTAFNVLLSRYSGSDDIILGSPIANRYHHDIEGLVGFFVNTLVLRNQVDSNKSVKELLNKISSDTLSAFDNQEVPFEQIVELLDITRDTSRNPIVQVMFSLQSFGGDVSGESALKLAGVDIKPYSDASFDVAKFDLSLFMSDGEDELVGSFNYCTDLFNQETIERISRNFERLLSAIVENSSAKINDLRLLTDERRKQILIDWNDTAAPYPKDKTIYQLFEEQVKKTPDNIAVIFEEEKLSYKDLNKKSNQLAYLIRSKYKKQNKKDLKPDSLIGLCVERSLDMIIGILGILKAGGAYVPLDPDYPEDRLEYMIEDSHEGLIITQKDIVAKDGFLDKLHHDELLVIDSDEVKADLSQQSDANLDKVSSPDNLAYVIYTSGSTGRPKGVLLPHHNVLRLFLATDDQYKFSNKDVWTLFHSYAFDFSVWEIWGPLLHGGKLVVVPHMVTRDPELFYDLVCEQKVTVLNQTPGAFQQFIGVDDQRSKKINSLRYVIFGGDALNIEILRPWWKNHADNKPLLVNMYGITETTVHVTYGALSKKNLAEANVGFIGKQIKDLQAYILDKNHNVCPIGAPGELYIGGAGLARGYLNQDKLTKERFITNPFAKELSLSKSDRIYKTGDLVRWLPDGNIEYLGRTDFQVKIRGFRIELGEIENVLAKHKDISQVSVIDKEKEGQKYLVAYYVITKAKAKAKKAPEIDDLRDHLSESLPDYMVPAAFVKLYEMPLTPNGKINRRALPEPDMSSMGEEYIAPRNEIEKKLADIWCEVLKLDKVGIEDDFFRIGGDSILSIQLVSKMRNEGFNLLVKDIFNNKTISQLSAHLASTQDSQVEIKSEQGLLTGDFDLLPIQRWFFDRMKAGDFTNPNHWNQSFVVKVEALELDKLKLLIPELVKQHDILRATYFVNKKGNWQQRYHKKIKIPKLKEIDVSKLNNKDELGQLLTSWQNNFDIEKGPLWQVGYLYGYPDGSERLFFAFHHLIIDSVSWRILIDDTKALYAGKDLSKKTCSYRQWINVVNTYPKKHKDEKAYWEHLQKAQGDFLKDIKLSADKQVGEVRLNKDLTNKLLKVANKAYHTEINDLLLTALAYALKSCSNQSANYITLEGHGREHVDASIDHSRTVGWFTTAYPVKLEVQDDLDQSIKIIKESLRLIPNKGLGYGAFCADQNKKTSLPPISFNYLGQFDSHEGYWQVINESSGIGMPFEDKDPNIININGAVMAGELSFSVVSHLSDEATKSFVKEFEKSLEKIIKNCDEKIKSKQISHTPSDLKDYIPYEIVNENLDMDPIFIFPPGDGGAEAYYDNLVPKLDKKKVILFNNILDYTKRTLGESHIKDMTFEDLAKDYILRLKRIQPEGPYCLVGWSFGGVLAVEVARMLVESGDKVSKLVLLDSLFNFEFALNQFKKMLSTDSEKNKLEDTFENSNINMNYKPSKFTLVSGSITLFKAMSLCDTTENTEYKFYNYYVKNVKANFIEKVLSDDVEIININAAHLNWFEFDDIVAQIVKKILE